MSSIELDEYDFKNLKNDKLVYYSKSSDKKAGFGTGEQKVTDADYSNLDKIKDWRKALSNFYVSPFILDENTWNTIEHFFHAVKFRNKKLTSKEYDYYKTFTLDSNSSWCRDPLLAKQAGKAGRISEKTKKIFDKKIGDVKVPKDVKMRDDFYSKKIPSKLQKLAFMAKFSQNPDLKDILLATGDAELWHYVGSRNSKPNIGSDRPVILITELMIVRDCIRKYDTEYDLNEITKFSSNFVSKILN